MSSRDGNDAETEEWWPCLRQLDAQQRGDHCFLEPADRCWYLATYSTGRRGQRLNALIADFKRSPAGACCRGGATLRRKWRAIAVIAQALRAVVGREFVESTTWVPIPPSASAADPAYDQRLRQVLEVAFTDYDLDVRDLLVQTRSTRADHLTQRRTSAEALAELLEITPQSAHTPLRAQLALFDDMLTTGKHFKCCEQRLRWCWPQVPICGLFVARRVLSHRQRGDRGPMLQTFG